MVTEYTGMNLDFGKVEKTESYSFRKKFDIPLEGGGSGECDAAVTGTLTPTGSRLLFSACAECTIRVVCNRCLQGFDYSLRTDFSLVFHRGSGGGPAEAGDEEDFIELMDTVTSYDVFPRVREAIILELPIKFLCREDCRGLCGKCGTNLNEGSCTCGEEEGDPRWDALKKLMRDEDDT